MTAKVHKIIVLSLLITSILASIVISITFRYSSIAETFLFETDLDINHSDLITYNGSLFDTPQHIYKISISNVKAKLDPQLTDISVKIIINGDYIDYVNGPYGSAFYNVNYAGEIEQLSFTETGMALTCHAEISSLLDMNPVYITLTTATCVIYLYFLYINAKPRIGKKSAEANIAE